MILIPAQMRRLHVHPHVVGAFVNAPLASGPIPQDATVDILYAAAFALIFARRLQQASAGKSNLLSTSR